MGKRTQILAILLAALVGLVYAGVPWGFALLAVLVVAMMVGIA